MEVAAFPIKRLVILQENCFQNCGNNCPEFPSLSYVTWTAIAILLLLEIKILWYFPIIILILMTV